MRALCPNQVTVNALRVFSLFRRPVARVPYRHTLAREWRSATMGGAMHTRVRTAGILVAIASVAAAAVAQRLQPIESLARVRVIVTTKAASASIVAAGATIASFVSSDRKRGV